MEDENKRLKKTKSKFLPRIRRPSTKPIVSEPTNDIFEKEKELPPPLLNIYFPDHDNKLLWYNFDENSRMSNLVEDVLYGPQSPVANNMHDVYALCIPKNKALNEERFWIPTKSDQRIWSYFLVSREMEYRMLPREKVEELQLNHLYLRIHGAMSKSIYLLKVPLYITCETVFYLLCEEYNIEDDEIDGFGLFWDDRLLLNNDILMDIGIRQMENLTFKHQNKFILRCVSYINKIDTLTLHGDITISDTINEIIQWLNIDISLSDIGLVKLQSILDYDMPIISWLPLKSRLVDWNLQTNDKVQLKSVNYKQIQTITLQFVSTPENLECIEASSSKFFINPKKYTLLDNEYNIAIFNNVCELHQQTMQKIKLPKAMGTLFITNYRIMLNSFNTNTLDSSQLHSVIFSVTLGEISRVEANKNTFTIFCKNFKEYTFQSTQVQQIYNTLEDCSKIDTNSCFAFKYKENYPEIYNGWHIYNFRKEMNRQGLPNSNWRIESTNVNYDLSPTYPQEYVVPSAILTSDLENVYAFRSKGRIPVLTYLHPYGGSISRSSQPLVGIKAKKSIYDKNVIDKIRKTAPNSSVLWMFDARPKASAVANRVLDGGYESNYNHCKLKFCNIDNIHVMRHSLKDFSNACNDISIPYYSSILQSKWFDHTLGILIAAQKAAKLVLNGHSILVHCSDGWDRTPQICTIAQLLLDPYYRTIEGFQVLIEKDWCSFGHKFSQRLGHCNPDYSDSERSPVFLQFIECVWHIKSQYPNEFEFNDSFLKCIIHHSTSCRFGTFLYDSDKERKDNKVSFQTVSLWTFMNLNNQYFINNLYEPTCHYYLRLYISDKILDIWKDIYCHQSDYAKKNQYYNMMKDNSISKLTIENQFLLERINELELEIKQKNNKECTKERPKQKLNIRDSLCLVASGDIAQSDSDDEFIILE